MSATTAPAPEATTAPVIDVEVTHETPVMDPAEVRSLRDGLGITRPMLMELTGLNGYRCWAVEQADKVDEPYTRLWRATVSETLRRVERDGLPEHMRVKTRSQARTTRKADLVERLDTVSALLDEAAEAKTLKDVRALLDRARVAAQHRRVR